MAHTHNIEWWVTKQIHKQCFEVYGHVKSGPKQLACVIDTITMKSLTPEEEEDGSEYQKAPTLSLSYDSVQSLMDELWSQGIRPSNGDGNVGQLAATKAHLEDMRKIAFDFLGNVK